MITLHHLERSRSIRVPWLLEELGLEYELVRHARDGTTNLAPPELLRLHPLGKAPLIEDGGRVIAESGAILEYLLDEYGQGRLRPQRGTDEYLRYSYWMHAAEGSFMNLLVAAMLFGRAGADTEAAKAIQANYLGPSVARLLPHVEEELGRGGHFAGGEFTAADVQMGFAMMGMAGAEGFSAESHPNCARWMKEMQARPAFGRAVERAGL